MTKIYYTEPPEEPDWKSTENSEGGCSYSIDQKAWIKDHPSRYVNKHDWKCPHPIEDGGDYCIFHQDIEDKEDEKVQSEFESVLKSDSRESIFIGAKFGTIDIRDSVLQDNNRSKIVLKNCLFYSGITFVDVNFLSRIEFSGSIFYGSLSFIDSTFEKGIQLDDTVFYSEATLSFTRCLLESDIDISDSILQSKFYLYKSKIRQELDISDTVFVQMASFQETNFLSGIHASHVQFTYDTNETCPTFHNSNIDGDLWMQDSKFCSECGFDELNVDGKLNLLRGYFEDDIDMERSTYDELIMPSPTLSGNINCNSTYIEIIRLFDLTINNGTGEIFLSGIESEIQSGEIFQPEEGDLIIDFSGASVGDISLKSDDHISILSPFNNLLQLFSSHSDVDLDNIRFFETDFEGFEFEDYLAEFEEIDWNIHKLKGESPKSNKLQFSISSNSDDISDKQVTREIREDLMTAENLIPTYLKAKHGASAVGDTKATGEFLFKEMKYRKIYYKNQFIQYLTSIFERKSSDAKFKSGPKWLLNSFLEVSCGYGERLWAIVAYSVIIILDYALIYPAFGGIFDESTVYTYSNVDTVQQFTDTFTQSLYYSSSTFSTLGTGQLTPNGPITRILSVSEALIGTFLLALLLFTLGRKVSR